jgi:hypothetical protein
MKTTLNLIRLSVVLLALVAITIGGGAPALAQDESPAAADAPEAAQAAPEATPLPQQAQAQRIFRGEWTVVVKGKAQANGVLELVFEPNGGEAKSVRSNVTAKTKDKKICQDLANQLAFTVGSDYKVKQNGNKVKVTAKNKKAAPFWLGVGNQSLTGVSVGVQK